MPRSTREARIRQAIRDRREPESRLGGFGGPPSLVKVTWPSVMPVEVKQPMKVIKPVEAKQPKQVVKPFEAKQPKQVVARPAVALPLPRPLDDPTIKLSEEQKAIAQLVLCGASVFFTGEAGTGKSCLLLHIINEVREHVFPNRPSALAITATTAIAAVNVGGQSLHSFVGMYDEDCTFDELLSMVLGSRAATARWIDTELLVIDEVSMLHGELFDMLNRVACRVRKNPKPFGGIQLVLCGDFAQLPPITDSPERIKFAFEADAWNLCVPNVYRLRQVFRQQDPVFIKILNEARLGKLSEESINCLKSLNKSIPCGKGEVVTELYPFRSDVSSANNRALRTWPGDLQTYQSKNQGSKGWLRHIKVPDQLELKVGIPVMLIKTIARHLGLVNGRRGHVLGFLTVDEYERRGEDFFATSDIQTDEELSEPVSAEVYPVVLFDKMGDGDPLQAILGPEEFIHKFEGHLVASRHQVPLVPAWALTIHKAQGQSLSRVKVDLFGTWEYGQAYVALSRATSLAGLELIRAHPRFLIWWETLKAVTDE